MHLNSYFFVEQNSTFACRCAFLFQMRRRQKLF